MTRTAFRVVCTTLSGRGLMIDIAELSNPADLGKRLAEIAEVVYLQGRDAVLPSYDDRFDLHAAVDALRALAVIVGQSPTGDRYRRAADIIAKLISDRESAP